MTPYAVLLTHPSLVSDKEIAKIYYVLARKLHPDVNQNAQDRVRWQEVLEAYNAIKTLTLRDTWAAHQQRLSGVCKDCTGYGVLSVYREGLVVCKSCKGQGRIKV
jgi:DnaJ-class molecular chaperone